MKNYKVTVEYDGTQFYGWQIQKRGRTVQGVIEESLSKLTQEPIKIFGSGRTDTGVHAYGQVFHVFISKDMTVEKLLIGSNALLPKDVSILAFEEVPFTFDARKSAKRKTYVYQFYESPFPRTFLDAYALRLRSGCDLEKMKSASELFVGTHDFGAYQAVGSTATNTVRTIYGVKWYKREACWCMEVEGNGFLYHMVRNMVGILLHIGRDKLKPSAITQSFDHRTRSQLPPTAPAHGLYLKKVVYAEVDVDTRGEVV